MNVGNKTEELLRNRVAEFSKAAAGSIGEILHFQILSYDEAANLCTMTCQTAPWMCNFAGTIHGGICATILDQAMGFIAYCMKPGEGFTPTVQLSADYHRPLIPGKPVLVKVRLVSLTHSFMSLSAEAMHADRPEKVCFSGTGIYYFKPSEG